MCFNVLPATFTCCTAVGVVMGWGEGGLATSPSALENIRVLLGASSEDLQLAFTHVLDCLPVPPCALAPEGPDTFGVVCGQHFNRRWQRTQLPWRASGPCWEHPARICNWL